MSRPSLSSTLPSPNSHPLRSPTSVMSDSAWTTVTVKPRKGGRSKNATKKGTKKKSLKLANLGIRKPLDVTDANVNALVSRLQQISTAMNDTPLFTSAVNLLSSQQTNEDGGPAPTTMIIYGVGMFENLLDSVTNDNFLGGIGNELNGGRQLGLALALVKHLKIQQGKIPPTPIPSPLPISAR